MLAKLLTFAVLTIALVAGFACAGGGNREVKVVLREWSISSSTEETTNGRLRFVVSNQGSMGHQLAIFKSDLPPDQLPLVDGLVDETKANLQAKVNLVDAGVTERLEVELSPGKYVLICNIIARDGQASVNHYESGMYASFFVRP